MSTFSTTLITTGKDNINQLIFIGESSIIKMTFSSKARAIKGVSDGNNEIDKINILDIVNLKSIKISF